MRSLVLSPKGLNELPKFYFLFPFNMFNLTGHSIMRTIFARTTWTNSSEGKPNLVVDQDQQYKKIQIEGKADRTAEG